MSEPEDQDELGALPQTRSISRWDRLWRPFWVLPTVIIVLAMNLVGSLLISALIVFPALSAMRKKPPLLIATSRSVLPISCFFPLTCVMEARNCCYDSMRFCDRWTFLCIWGSSR